MSVVQFLILGLCCTTISYTLTKGSIFLPLRAWLIDHNLWLAKLFQCPYCMSHWVALGLMLVYHPQMVHSGYAWVDYITTGFALTGLSALGTAAIFKLYYTPES